MISLTSAMDYVSFLSAYTIDWIGPAERPNQIVGPFGQVRPNYLVGCRQFKIKPVVHCFSGTNALEMLRLIFRKDEPFEAMLTNP